MCHERRVRGGKAECAELQILQGAPGNQVGKEERIMRKDWLIQQGRKPLGKCSELCFLRFRSQRYYNEVL